jgi:hypothetical protein
VTSHDVDSAGSSGVARTPTSFVNGRRQYGAYDIDTLTAAVKTAKAQPKLDVPYRPGQVDDNQADAAVLPAWSPERAFRRPTLQRAFHGWKRLARASSCCSWRRWHPATPVWHFRPLRPTARCSSGAPPEPDQTIDLKARAV